jgi:uncharacterized membrane protein
MKPFYKKALLFWFVLLLLALINATIRETTYKPLLTPVIGMWAHQISSITGILLFYFGIYQFLKRTKEKYNKSDLIKVGVMWIVMTVVFESLMNTYIRHLSFKEVLETYYFWKGDTWIFVLLSLIISPLVAFYNLRNK